MTTAWAPRTNKQLKKGQGESNDRLEQLYQEQQRTNQLLEWIGLMVHAQLTDEQRAEVTRLSGGKSD